MHLARMLVIPKYEAMAFLLPSGTMKTSPVLSCKMARDLKAPPSHAVSKKGCIYKLILVLLLHGSRQSVRTYNNKSCLSNKGLRVLATLDQRDSAGNPIASQFDHWDSDLWSECWRIGPTHTCSSNMLNLPSLSLSLSL